MSKPDTANIVPLADICFPQDGGKKVRVAGYLTAFDPPTSIGLLTHEKAHIPVDFSLCLVDDIFIPALKSKVMVMGELEQRDEVISPKLLLAAGAPQPPVKSHSRPHVLSAIWMRQVDELDLEIWMRAARARTTASASAVS